MGYNKRNESEGGATSAMKSEKLYWGIEYSTGEIHYVTITSNWSYRRVSKHIKWVLQNDWNLSREYSSAALYTASGKLVRVFANFNQLTN